MYSEFDTSHVRVDVAARRFPAMLVVLLIVTIDALAQLVAIRRDMAAAGLDYDAEMKLNGIYSAICGLGVGPPEYTMVEFTVVNKGIIHNNTDRLPGITYSCILLALHFSAFPIINYLPRFMLSLESRHISV